MLRYVTALNKKKLEEKIRDSEIYLIRNLISEEFEIPFDNVVFDSVTNYFFVRDKKGSNIANISLEIFRNREYC